MLEKRPINLEMVQEGMWHYVEHSKTKDLSEVEEPARKAKGLWEDEAIPACDFRKRERE